MTYRSPPRNESRHDTRNPTRVVSDVRRRLSLSAATPIQAAAIAGAARMSADKFELGGPSRVKVTTRIAETKATRLAPPRAPGGISANSTTVRRLKGSAKRKSRV